MKSQLLWEPTGADIADANITNYMRWLGDERGLDFDSYDQLWNWSVGEIDRFWRSIWDYFDVKASKPPEKILGEEIMPGAKWFSGALLNYSENFFSREWKDRTAILYFDEGGSTEEISWEEIRTQSAQLANALKGLGIIAGDRVVAYMPHIPEAVVGLFAAASLGAIWSSCSPDFGSRSVLDRFQQIEPKVLLAVDGYQYNGKIFDRRQVVTELQQGLPSLEATILFPFLTGAEASEASPGTLFWDELLKSDKPHPELTFEQVPFDHPLWVLYSSGTTGLPKPIVQGHGGILLEHLKMAALHLDLKAGDRFFWYTSTGWMMWNFLVGGLLTGATIVIYNGSPAFPDLNVLWKLAVQSGITYFGCSAAFINACIKAGINPSEKYDLSRIKAVGSTGSPLSEDGFRWVYKNVNKNLSVQSVSGGTDLCTAFVGGCKLLPVYAGEIQAAALGASVKAFDKDGNSIVGQLGELVITKPMPSMPIYFWNDLRDERYKTSYFDVYPNIWRHGDWIKFTDRGSCIIYGRSDSTINRQGIRMGTSEIYRAVESLPQIQDSLIIDLELLGRESYMPLFVVLTPGANLNDRLRQQIKEVIRRDISPRHVPDEIFVTDEVPYTLSGKKMEVPVRRILLGDPVEEAVNPGAMRNPQSVGFFVHFSEALAAQKS
jgi:acetoacetyl-CoA synthetase